MTSSIKSQSIAPRSSNGDGISSWGIVKASVCQRGARNGAIGVLSSLGGPGGTGRIGSGRTLSWPDETDPSNTVVRCVRGEFGDTRTSGEPEDSRCGGARGRIKSGNVG